ncbi:MAG: helix-turn-helix domain-containing protein [Myxococcaceae bacterium]|nr:helix-turn-helix domain-containing protein [Myxococcaceae bacterium]
MKADNGSSPTGKAERQSHALEPKSDAVLTVPEAATLLRLNPKTVYEAVSRGELPHQRIGRRIRLSRSALITWLSQGQGRVPRSKEKKS